MAYGRRFTAGRLGLGALGTRRRRESVEVGRGGKMNAGRRPGISLDALVAR